DQKDTVILINSKLPPYLVRTGDTLSGIPRGKNVGTDTILITVSDRDGLKATAVLPLRVIHVNHAPTVSGRTGPALWYEDSSMSMTIVAHDIDAGDTLSVAMSKNMAWLSKKSVAVDSMWRVRYRLDQISAKCCRPGRGGIFCKRQHVRSVPAEDSYRRKAESVWRSAVCSCGR
ncbi:MAG: hypothetical protein MUF22_04395, partial [Chitinispirillaceae bacterium]|nr:hypothetical protein [Chitinispirillaceae bacterium]